MNTHDILIVCIIIILSSILANYLIYGNHESRIIKDVIDRRILDDEIDDEEVYELEDIESKYKKNRFKISIVRGIVVSVIFIVFIQMTKKNEINIDSVNVMGVRQQTLPPQHMLNIGQPLNNNIFNQLPSW